MAFARLTKFLFQVASPTYKQKLVEISGNWLRLVEISGEDFFC